MVVAINEKLIHAAIDRVKDGLPPRKANEAGARKWLGKNLSIQTNRNLHRVLDALWSRYYQDQLREQSWKNLPILNEWKRLFPEQDAVQLHRKLWGQKLICPGGGSYVWDTKNRTYRSTVFGSPVMPRTPMGTPYPYRDIKSLDAGITFELGGVRAKVHLRKK